MGLAKQIELKPMKSSVANNFIRQHHYSGKVVQNSVLHIGVFWRGGLEGVLSFGSSLDKRKIQKLVAETGWNEFIELNRMAFTDKLPRNSESRAIAIACKLIKKHKPNMKWIVSFADACQCGDGTIYRASGFILTGIKENKKIYKLPFSHELNEALCRENGLTEQDILWVRRWLDSITKMNTERAPRVHSISIECGNRPSSELSEGGNRPSSELSAVQGIMRRLTNGGTSANKFFKAIGGEVESGFQLRYVKFLDPNSREKLTVPEIPFEEIKRRGASMYKGKRADD